MCPPSMFSRTKKLLTGSVDTCNVRNSEIFQDLLQILSLCFSSFFWAIFWPAQWSHAMWRTQSFPCKVNLKSKLKKSNVLLTSSYISFNVRWRHSMWGTQSFFFNFSHLHINRVHRWYILILILIVHYYKKKIIKQWMGNILSLIR